ncbi:hypothetical protein TrispH2_009375 [Trichoplax sp. H2]|nr:hypothetical protein TrispH2_009375 [Trichoplax sp. H2]|eukprot:RDD38221.1 hypothetical protein TrispH2_009375 [Trichoplax sp. H2]
MACNLCLVCFSVLLIFECIFHIFAGSYLSYLLYLDHKTIWPWEREKQPSDIRIKRSSSTDLSSEFPSNPDGSKAAETIVFIYLTFFFSVLILLVVVKEKSRLCKPLEEECSSTRDKNGYCSVSETQEITFMALFTSSFSVLRCFICLMILIILIGNLVSLPNNHNKVRSLNQQSKTEIYCCTPDSQYSGFLGLAYLGILTTILSSSIYGDRKPEKKSTKTEKSSYHSILKKARNFLRVINYIFKFSWLVLALVTTTYYEIYGSGNTLSLENLDLNTLYSTCRSSLPLSVIIFQLENLCQSKENAMKACYKSINIMERQFQKAVSVMLRKKTLPLEYNSLQKICSDNNDVLVCDLDEKLRNNVTNKLEERGKNGMGCKIKLEVIVNNGKFSFENFTIVIINQEGNATLDHELINDLKSAVCDHYNETTSESRINENYKKKLYKATDNGWAINMKFLNQQTGDDNKVVGVIKVLLILIPCIHFIFLIINQNYCLWVKCSPYINLIHKNVSFFWYWLFVPLLISCWKNCISNNSKLTICKKMCEWMKKMQLENCISDDSKPTMCEDTCEGIITKEGVIHGLRLRMSQNDDNY